MTVNDETDLFYCLQVDKNLTKQLNFPTFLESLNIKKILFLKINRMYIRSRHCEKVTKFEEFFHLF